MEEGPAGDATRAATAAAAFRAESTANPALDPLVGRTLADRYRLVRRIAEGGMGAVYEARHTVIDKRVAVKVLLERLTEKRDLVARLLQEARMASSIGHENIVDVTDFGTTDDGRSFVVMEFLEGEPLSALLARDAPLSVPRSLRLCRQVASALEAAHEKGIVHRDVKPENVYLVRRGDDDFVKVVDFGVSKAVATHDEGFEGQRLTRTGVILGTPLYMSPEQARGGDVDHRGDVWSVGVLLYECLTGEVPFRALNYLAVISEVTTKTAIPPSQLRPELQIPPAVEAVVMRALEKDRDRRYPTMRALRVALDRLLAGDGGADLADPDGQPAIHANAAARGPRWYLPTAAILVLAAGVAAVLLADRPRTASPVPALTKPTTPPRATVSPVRPPPATREGAAPAPAADNKRRPARPERTINAPPADEGQHGEPKIPLDRAFPAR